MFDDIRNHIDLINTIQESAKASDQEVIMEGREDKMSINNWIAFERVFDAYKVKVEQDDKFGTIDIWVGHHLVGQWHRGINLGWFNKALLATLPADHTEIDPIDDKLGA